MKITPLKMWVQNVLPVVYDDSLSYYEMVGKINEKTNEIIEQLNENTDGIEALNKIIEQLGDVDELKALLKQVETIINDLYTTDIPAMDSETGSAGVADHAARSDHSHPSDTSKADVSLGIDSALAGQYVKIKSVEAGVPTEFENGMPHEVPSGGTTGQALRKESSGDYAADWADVHEIPSGGTTSQALRKESNGDYAADWADVHEIPSGGNKDSVLIKNSNSNYDTGWTNTPSQMGSLATIEPTSTVTQKTQYAQGEYLVYNGQLYKVTASTITRGETLDPGQGGNIAAVQDGGMNELVARLTPALYMQSIYVGAERAILITPPGNDRFDYLIFSGWNERIVLGLASIYINENKVNWNGLPLLQGSTMTASIESGKLKLTTGQQIWSRIGVISTKEFTLEKSNT